MSNRILVLTELGSVVLPVLRTLGGRGFEVAVAGAGDGAFVRLSRHCASYARVAADGREMSAAGPATLDAVERLVRALAPELVVPVDVPGARLASALKARVPGQAFFPAPEPATLDLLDDKWSFHGFLTREGLPTPRTWLVERGASAPPALPVVVKPLAESGGRGVAVVRTAAQYEARLAGSAFPLLAQEFVDGEDVDLSFLADRGRLLAWAVQMRAPDGSMVFLEDERVVEAGRRVAAATGYTGMAHLDMRYDGPARDRFLIIECNPRFWATFSYTIGLGVDFMDLGLALARGESLAPIARSPVGSSPGLRAAVRKLLRGGSLAGDSFESVRQKLLDPGPELYKAGRRLLRLS